MKKTAFTLMAGVALLTACQPTTDKRARMDIELTEMQNDTLVIGSRLFPIAGNQEKIDTILPKQAKYTFTAETDSLLYEVFIAPAKNLSKAVVAILLPGDQLTVTGNIENCKIAGSTLNEGIQQIAEACKPYRAKMDSISRIMVKMQNEHVDQAEVQKVYFESYRPVMEQMIETRLAYIRQHPDEDLSLYLLCDVGSKYFDELYPTLSDKVKKGPLVSAAQAIEKNMKQKQSFEENKKKIVEGAEAPDFTLKDIQGNDLALSSLRGKYVVLDFWGSWCGWCIKGIPDMKKYYEKYKGKMEILGIDCRDTEEKWKAAVEKHKLPWLHVRNEGNPDVSLLYAIQGYPTKIVIDPEGKIAKVVIGEDPAFYEYLDELFK